VRSPPHRYADKINVHTPRLWKSKRFTLKGPTARPGCGDFCFVWNGSVDELRQVMSPASSLCVLSCFPGPEA